MPSFKASEDVGAAGSEDDMRSANALMPCNAAMRAGHGCPAELQDLEALPMCQETHAPTHCRTLQCAVHGNESRVPERIAQDASISEDWKCQSCSICSLDKVQQVENPDHAMVWVEREGKRLEALQGCAAGPHITPAHKSLVSGRYRPHHLTAHAQRAHPQEGSRTEVLVNGEK